MDREELLTQMREEIRQRFLALSEEEQEVIRENRDTQYAQILREVLGEEILAGLRTRPATTANNPSGLAAPV